LRKTRKYARRAPIRATPHNVPITLPAITPALCFPEVVEVTAGKAPAEADADAVEGDEDMDEDADVDTDDGVVGDEVTFSGESPTLFARVTLNRLDAVTF